MTISKNCKILVIGKKLNEGVYNDKPYKNYRVSITYERSNYIGFACDTVSAPFELFSGIDSFPVEFKGTVNYYKGRVYVTEWSKL